MCIANDWMGFRRSYHSIKQWKVEGDMWAGRWWNVSYLDSR